MVPLLKLENTQLRSVNTSWQKTDSLKTVQLSKQNQMMLQQAQDIERLSKNLKVSYTVAGTAVGVSIVVTILCLFLK
jgi:hypothetical protein